MELSNDTFEFIRLLNQNRVEYLIIGGWAVAFHGKPRYTKDIDVLIRPSVDNAVNILRSLHEFGFGALDETQEDLVRPDFIIQLGFEPNRIDLVTGIPAVDFSEAYNRREVITLQKEEIPFIGRDDLIRNKLAAGRDQDIADAKSLAKLKK
jgi:hypothetical protein